MNGIRPWSVLGGSPKYQTCAVCWLFQLGCSWRVVLQCFEERISEVGVRICASLSSAAEGRYIVEAPIEPRLKDSRQAREDQTGDDDS